MPHYATPIVELRATPRRRTFLNGTILFPDRSRSLSCTLRNAGEGGARLDLAETIWVPPNFQIHVPQTGETRQARLVWRKPESVGIRFC